MYPKDLVHILIWSCNKVLPKPNNWCKTQQRLNSAKWVPPWKLRDKSVLFVFTPSVASSFLVESRPCTVRPEDSCIYIYMIAGCSTPPTPRGMVCSVGQAAPHPPGGGMVSPPPPLWLWCGVGGVGVWYPPPLWGGVVPHTMLPHTLVLYNTGGNNCLFHFQTLQIAVSVASRPRIETCSEKCF